MKLSRLLLSVVAACLLTVSASAEILFLKDGRFMHVKVLSGDERGVNVERLDNEGKLFIRWKLLRDEDAKRLKIQFGLEEDDSEADLVMVGHRVYPRKGDYKDGLIIERTQEQIVFLHQGKKDYYLPKAIRKIEDRQVSVFDVYKPEELYQQRLTELQPTDDDIEGHDAMARWSTKIGMYDEAIMHWQKIGAEDAEYRADYIANQLERLQVLARNKDILNAVKEAESNGYRRRYKRCLAIFDEVLGQSDLDKSLRKDVEKKKEKFTKKRWEHFSRLVVNRYFREVHRRIDAIARSRDVHDQDKEKAMTIDKAMSELRSKMHKDIVKAIAEKYELDEKKEVEKMWKERRKRATRTASYGSGTFIVQKVDKKEGQNRRGSAAEQRMQELIRNMRRGRRGQQQQQQQPRQQKLMTKDQWWRRVDSAQRSFWLRAYYAEHCGQMEVVNEWIRQCTECGATGTIKQTGPDGTMLRLTCPRCQGRKADRVIVYR